MQWGFPITPPLDSSHLANETLPYRYNPPDVIALPNQDTQAAASIQRSNTVFEPWACHCGSQPTDFCPYCDYYERPQILSSEPIGCIPYHSPFESVIDNLGAPPQPVSSTISFPKPRKLRKARHDYPDLHHDSLHLDGKALERASPTPSTNLQPSQAHLHGVCQPKRRQSGSSSITLGKYENVVESKSGSNQVVKSKSFLRSKKKKLLGPRPIPVSDSIETEALVSLAWTGEVLPPLPAQKSQLLDNIVPSSGVFACSSSFYTSAAGALRMSGPLSFHDREPPRLQPRRSTLRKRPDPLLPKLTSKAWTLAMAITDDGVSDEKLVDDLEKMRIKDPVDCPDGQHEYHLSVGPPLYGDEPSRSDLNSAFRPSENGDQENLPHTPWSAARRALLVCRELVQTERRYLLALKTLITNGTTCPPPAKMLPYLPALISASERFLLLMEENPSVQGVSEAFLASEHFLYEAFIRWSEVVGQFFGLDALGKEKSEPELHAAPGKLARVRSSSMTIQNPCSEGVVVRPEPNRIRRNTKARPTVRDLAIMPTQRITRYVLLFKELDSLVPNGLPSHTIVKQALLLAEMIAQQANEHGA